MSTIGQLESQAVNVGSLYDPTRGELESKLREFRPHVIHFIGHGKFEDEQGWLALEDEKDHEVADWITDDTFASNLTQGEFPRPRLVFLDACEGAYSSSYEAFRGTALKLVRSYIPAVVAMQYKVENEVANLFADAFYRSLSQGNPVDEAVQAGRLKLKKFLSEKNSSAAARSAARSSFCKPPTVSSSRKDRTTLKEAVSINVRVAENQSLILKLYASSVEGK